MKPLHGFWVEPLHYGRVLCRISYIGLFNQHGTGPVMVQAPIEPLWILPTTVKWFRKVGSLQEPEKYQVPLGNQSVCVIFYRLLAKPTGLVLVGRLRRWQEPPERALGGSITGWKGCRTSYWGLWVEIFTDGFRYTFLRCVLRETHWKGSRWNRNHLVAV